MKDIKVYGADWCPKTVRTLEFLTAKVIPHVYINVEEDAAASEWVKSQNHGKELKPTIDLGGQVLAEPSNVELEEALDKQTSRAPR